MYRSIAGYVRDAGGYDKVPEAFAEVVWADFFRRAVQSSSSGRTFTRQLRRPSWLRRAAMPKRNIPGFNGSSREGLHELAQPDVTEADFVRVILQADGQVAVSFIAGRADIRRGAFQCDIVLYQHAVVEHRHARRRIHRTVRSKPRRRENDVVGLPFAGRQARIHERRILFVDGAGLAVDVRFVFKRIEHLHFVHVLQEHAAVGPILTDFVRRQLRCVPFDMQLHVAEARREFECRPCPARPRARPAPLATSPVRRPSRFSRHSDSCHRTARSRPTARAPAVAPSVTFTGTGDHTSVAFGSPAGAFAACARHWPTSPASSAAEFCSIHQLLR